MTAVPELLGLTRHAFGHELQIAKHIGEFDAELADAIADMVEQRRAALRRRSISCGKLRSRGRCHGSGWWRHRIRIHTAKMQISRQW